MNNDPETLSDVHDWIVGLMSHNFSFFRMDNHGALCGLTNHALSDPWSLCAEIGYRFVKQQWILLKDAKTYLF